MSLQTQHLLEFGEFRLDLVEKHLKRGDAVIPITPKVFETLHVLVENAGHLVEKDELMQRIWQDRFVEEGNLAFNIKMLRKALGDDASDPRFIETVPRRGYRFIADVRESLDAIPSVPGTGVSSTQATFGSRKLNRYFFIAAAILITGTIVSGLWYARTANLEDEAPVLLAAFSSEVLSADGNVRVAAVSPDGKSVVYANHTGDKESIWLRNLESSNNVQIIPPSENLYFGLTISPDGRTLYFTRIQQDHAVGQPADVYRVSIFGGVPEKIISQNQGAIGLSPDGSRISFCRCPHREDEYCSLWIADSDGRNERRLLSRPSPTSIGTNKFSPDGKAIAFAVGQSGNWANDFGLSEVDIESGVEREITPERFFSIRGLAWLPNGRGLLLTALKYPDNNYRIWNVSTTTSRSTPITNDAESYITLSLDKEARVSVCTKQRADYSLKVYQPDKKASLPRVLADASTVGFAPDGKVIFSSAMTGNHEIWTINTDGSEQRQLTYDPAVDLNGMMSPNNSLIFFDSNRSGEDQVWRMNADGTEQRQLTFKDGGTPLRISADGKWLYYLSARSRKLMRIPADGGGEELVWDRSLGNLFALSPDASRGAYAEMQNKKAVISILSLAEKQTLRVFDVPNEKSGFVHIAWSPDGNSLFYVAPDEKHENYVIWRQPLDGSLRVRIADLGPDELRETRAFAVSPDGQSFAAIQGRWKQDAVLLKGLK